MNLRLDVGVSELDELLEPPPSPRKKCRRGDSSPLAIKALWERIGIGLPRCNSQGMPVYQPFELALDGTVHVLGTLWTAASVGALLVTSQSLQYCVYSASMLLIFCTSALYNMVGCGLQFWTELLRKIDQASIFIAIGGLYTVFVRSWQLLLAIWVVCGTFAALKLLLGRRIEMVSIGMYVLLGLAPLGLVEPTSRAYPTILGGTLALLLGAVFGYLNNHVGGTAFWHTCILAASVAYWVLVFRAAKHGPEYLLSKT